MLNTQKPEPRTTEGGGTTIDLHSVFHTIQGEGPFAGRPAFFIRLAGCNLQCPGCDTEYTWGRQHVPVSEIVASLNRTAHAKTNLVVITGGEPLRQNIGPLVYELRSVGFTVQIESNGLLPLTPPLRRQLLLYGGVHLVVSPKTARINAECAKIAYAFKYVVNHADQSTLDGLPITALGHAAKPFVARPPEEWLQRNGVNMVFLNPMDEKDPEINRKNHDAARDASLRFGYTLGVQMHKIVNLP